MPSYKLNYFGIRGRAEPIRMMFAAAGVPFQDKRISQEEWPNLKDSIPGKSLPVLDIDGEVLSQSLVITRHVAKTLGFSGKTLTESTRIEEITEYVTEMNMNIVSAVFTGDQEAINKSLQNSKTACDVVEETIAKYSKGKGIAVGSTLSLADIAILSSFETLLMQKPDALDGYKNIAGVIANVKGLPKMKEYLDKRGEPGPF